MPVLGGVELCKFKLTLGFLKPESNLWMRGTELPRTESREGRKKASADVCTMSRAAPRSRTCKVEY